jgi:glucuronoarabinoxylan endo-1,4-beta-xylanase
MFRKSQRLLSAAAVGFAVLALLGREANAADATVDLSATKQLIRGFGASSAWCGTLSTSIMDSLYKDLGYSILRVRIEENIGDAWSSGNFSAWKPELTNAQNAIARGAIVFASPWNPPASMKSGGKLITSKYADYANYLKAYAKYFADNNAPLYAISIQNEPDYATDWTAWTADDLHNFLTAQGATLSAAVKVMMPESFQFRHPMSDPSLNDATVASYISIIGGHLYGAGIATYPLATNQGKELWETEHYFDDDTIANVMKLGKEVHDCMVTASMNAYVYWWITWPNGLADSSGTIFKRAYALGQFAKYIRPGYHRVDATASPATNLNVSAYTGENKVVIVAVNSGTASVNQNFVLRGGTASQVSSWQTTASANMGTGQAYQASNGSFTASLPSQSITTFVGSLSGTSGTGGNTSTGGASGAGGKTGTGGSSATPGTGGRSGVGGTSGVGGATVTQTGGRNATGGTPGVGGATVTQTGGRNATGGTPGVGGATVTQTGGRNATGGTPGVGGATGGAGVGGGVSSGGQGPSGGAENVSGGATALGAGGAATGGSSGSLAQGDTGGAVNDGTLTPPGESGGCGCVVAGKDVRSLGGGLGAFLMLWGLALTRRRASAG